MVLTIYSVNFKTADIVIREKYYLCSEKIDCVLLRAKQLGILPFVVLSTCNRTEFYCSEFLKIPLKQLVDYPTEDLMKINGIDAIRHLFRLTSGLESQIIGENEIIGQVKKAYYKTLNLGLTDKFFNLLFNYALRIGKKVRTETKISVGNVSFASIVYKKIKEILGNQISKKNFVLLGTGEIAQSVLKYFSKHNINLKIVSGRNFDKALILARMYNAEVFKFEQLEFILNNADIIIVATSAPHYLLKRENMRNNKNIIVFDLSVPRNVSPDIVNEKVILYNLDDLKKIRDENFTLRKKSIPEAEKIIEDGIREFLELWETRKKLELEQDHQSLH